MLFIKNIPSWVKVGSWTALVLSVVSVFACVAVFVFAVRSGPQDQYAQLQEQWRRNIRTKGAQVAMRGFEEYQRTQPVALQHRISHSFGAALYDELGEKAIGICTFEYDSGCIHEIFRQASDTYGAEALIELEKTCEREKTSDGSCTHALGHGFVAKYGYDKQSLLRALDGCSKSGEGDPVLGCAGGVFMEYNGYYLSYPSLAPRDPTNGWYEPCMGIPTEHERACVWWLTRWWAEYMQSDPIMSETVFERMGDLCHELPLSRYRRECFESLGQKITIPLQWSPDKIIAECKAITQDSDEELWCRSYAAAMFINRVRNTDIPAGVMLSATSRPTQFAGREVCEGLSTERKVFCLAYANNKNYIHNELPTPQ